MNRILISRPQVNGGSVSHPLPIHGIRRRLRAPLVPPAASYCIERTALTQAAVDTTWIVADTLQGYFVAAPAMPVPRPPKPPELALRDRAGGARSSNRRRGSTEPDASAPPATALPLAPEPTPAVSGDLDDAADVVHLTESSVRRIRALLQATTMSLARDAGAPTPEELHSERALERHLAALEGLLAKLETVEAGPGVPASLTVDLEAARVVCEVVEGLLEARGWRVSRGPGSA